MKSFLQFALAYLAGLAFAMLVTACAQPVAETPSPVDVTKNPKCKAGPDQRLSFMAALPSNGVVTAAMDSQFSEEEKGLIQRAVQTWNDTGSALRQRPFFSVTAAATLPEDAPQSNDDCSFSGNANENFKIVRVSDEARWTAIGMTANNPAVTIRCYSGGDLTKQVILVYANPKVKNSPDTRQFQSVMLHEFGHALGLDHSCNAGTGNNEFRTCSGMEVDHPYKLAVMYPKLRGSSDLTVMPEIKETLASNDQDRAACLYAP